jgi:hypothetical protein
MGMIEYYFCVETNQPGLRLYPNCNGFKKASSIHTALNLIGKQIEDNKEVASAVRCGLATLNITFRKRIDG